MCARDFTFKLVVTDTRTLKVRLDVPTCNKLLLAKWRRAVRVIKTAAIEMLNQVTSLTDRVLTDQCRTFYETFCKKDSAFVLSQPFLAEVSAQCRRKAVEEACAARKAFSRSTLVCKVQLCRTSGVEQEFFETAASPATRQRRALCLPQHSCELRRHYRWKRTVTFEWFIRLLNEMGTAARIVRRHTAYVWRCVAANSSVVLASQRWIGS